MTMNRVTAATTLAVTSVLLTVCLVGSGAAVGGPLPLTTSATTEWAYGAVRTVQFAGVDGSGHTFEGSATYGFSVILNETANTSSGGVTNTTVHLNRTIGALISAEYCLGHCSSGTELANFSFHAWDQENAWANLTTGGTVNVTGVGDVPALALTNSSESVHAYLRESIQLGHGQVPVRYTSLFVNVTGAAQVALAPSLGLFPINLSALPPAASWASASAYSASGSVHWSTWLSNWGSAVLHPGNVSNGGTDTLTGSGTVSLTGTYPADSVFSYDHASFPALNLTVVGPFTLSEGVLLVPADADLFASASHPWSGNQSGSSLVTSSFVDVHSGASYQGHLPVVASRAGWVSVTTDAAAVIPLSAPAPLLPSAAIVPAAASNSTVVQGQPESIAQATSNQACLVKGVGCVSAGPSVPWLRDAIAGGVVVVIAGVLAAALVSRRKMPPPAYPNAQLYPPGGAGRVIPAPTRPAPKPVEDDPLGHLW